MALKPARLRVIATVTAALLAGAVDAQQPAVTNVRGQVYDSLRGRPLSDALVLAMGIPTTATTDARGRFRLDSVPAGVHTFIVHHASLDTIGLSVLTVRAAVTADAREVQLALPSFPTVWKAVCGSEPRPDSGLVFGTIRASGNRAPVAHASVDLTWIETTYDRVRGIRQRRVRGELVTDANGNYALCGIPVLHWLRVDARHASGDSGGVAIPPTDLRVHRRDLLIGPPVTDSAGAGTILGVLKDPDGYPFSEARVILDDSTETRSNADGRFAFRGVRTGTRLVEIQSIGMIPIIVVVDVFPRDTASITRELRRVTTLDVVKVVGSSRAQRIAQALEERRKSGFGYTMDMAEVQAYTSFANALNEFPAVRLDKKTSGDYTIWVSDGRGGECQPTVWIDGARMAMATLNMVAPKEVIAVELFARPSTVPIEFRRTEQNMACGAIMVWTTWAFSR